MSRGNSRPVPTFRATAQLNRLITTQSLRFTCRFPCRGSPVRPAQPRLQRFASEGAALTAAAMNALRSSSRTSTSEVSGEARLGRPIMRPRRRAVNPPLETSRDHHVTAGAPPLAVRAMTRSTRTDLTAPIEEVRPASTYSATEGRSEKQHSVPVRRDTSRPPPSEEQKCSRGLRASPCIEMTIAGWTISWSAARSGRLAWPETW